MPSRKAFYFFQLWIRRVVIIILFITFLGSFAGESKSFAQARANSAVIDKPKILVRGDYDYPPYEFTQNGEPTGFNVDLMRTIAKVMGYEVEIRLGPWNEVRSDLENKRIDVLTGMYYSEERSKLVDFSAPHISVGSGLFVRKDSNIGSLEEMRGKAILVQNGDIMHDYLKRVGLTDQIIPITEPVEALRMLASGQYDGVLLSSLIQGLYFTKEYGLSNLKAIHTNLQAQRYCFAVSKGNLTLLQDLNEGLNILHRTGQYDEIYNRWFGIYEQNLLERNLYILWVVLVASALLILSLLWSWSLRKQVALRTAALARSEEKYRILNAELERRVIERTRQLEESTHEIETFTYSVSHDLRAPLRAINGYSLMLAEEYAELLSPEAQHLLARTQQNTRQMARLIDDLLTFIQIGRQKLVQQIISPELLVRQAMEELSKEQEGRPVEFVLGDLPNCEADPGLIKLVFSHLLSNALKFTRDRPIARIEVGFLSQSSPQGSASGLTELESGCFFVRDNGAGFDMRYVDKLFGVFQRLHSPREYEGTGIGLANVQRIINRHGGRIWAQSEINQGATFYFTLGKIQT